MRKNHVSQPERTESRCPYEQPVLEVLGSVTQLTKMPGGGVDTDVTSSSATSGGAGS